MNPLIGRPVLYFPAQDDGFPANQGEALAGVVAHVDPDGKCALGVWDQRGRHHAVQGVRLYHPGEPTPPPGGRYAVSRGVELFGQPPPFAKVGTAPQPEEPTRGQEEVPPAEATAQEGQDPVENERWQEVLTDSEGGERSPPPAPKPGKHKHR